MAVVFPTPNAAIRTPNSPFESPPPKLSIPLIPVGIGSLKSSASTSSTLLKTSIPSSL